ncbi:MAG: hypothetical protein J6V01_07620, partial [Clostridia bacterium]|nr:hypothetical protein [Clostridia bacterium]
MTSFRGKRRAALTAMLLCAAVFLGSCAGDTPSQESTAADGTLPVTEISTEQADLPIVIDDSFIIVRPDGGAGSALLSALSALRNGILDKYGVAVTPKTDWLNTRAGEQPAENEILLGLTNRPESALLAETLTGKYQYAIAVVDGKLTIAGGSEQALAAAVNYLLGALPDKPEFAKDYEYRGEIPMSERTVYIKDEIVGEHVYYELA